MPTIAGNHLADAQGVGGRLAGCPGPCGRVAALPAVGCCQGCGLSSCLRDGAGRDEHGRTVFWASLAGEAANAAAPDMDKLASARLAAVGGAVRLAAARFWSSVEEFAHNAVAMEAFDGLGADHPLLRRRAGRVEVRQPAPAQPLAG
eukprot:364922-Chlamydomonas_euryale.AAC.3